MWDPLEPLLPADRRVRRHELRGFGETPLPEGPFSHADDLEAALAEPSVLVGASFGGWVALSVAARRPELVAGLVLIDAPLEGHEWSAEMEDHWSAEDALLEAGDLSGAAELSVSFWVGVASADVRDAVLRMTLRSFELQTGREPEEIESPAVALGEVRTPTLVIAGSLDREDFRRIADRLAEELPQARHVMIDGAAHLPAMERPQATAREIGRFLASPDAGAERPAG